MASDQFYRALKGDRKRLSTIASREWIEDNTKVTIPANKRNYRKQKDHVKVMNTMKALKKQLGEEVKEGRPKGSGTAEQTVREWQESHPNTGIKQQVLMDNRHRPD